MRVIKREIDQKLDYIIETYTNVVQGINQEALNEKERAYGGIIRSGKGNLLNKLLKT